ncbi:thiamine diphosphate-binding protein [Aspergillus pseudodeflectus]|uniref:Thiamine diphosphate-binding protein n=1 Tax=Aspergillus pseudodeflectus TaxID=176178 RepID=A0ABR4L4I6_9EURO
MPRGLRHRSPLSLPLAGQGWMRPCLVPSPARNIRYSTSAFAHLAGRTSMTTIATGVFVGLSGGAIFHRMMVKHGVKHIFGYPGGAILPAFDAIHKALEFDFILPRHEQGAGHMVGSQVATARVGSDAFQEANVLGMSQPCTKWDVSVRDAFEIVTFGCPGPVLVELSIDVTASILRRPIPQSETYRPTTLSLAMGNIQRLELHRTLERVAHLIDIAKQPELYVGQGMLTSPHGPHLLKKLADKALIPVTTSIQGLGAYDEHDPKALHMLGLNGSSYANLAVQNVDLAVGGGWGGVVHFDVPPKNVNKVVQVTEALIGDCAQNLELLLPLVKEKSRREWLGGSGSSEDLVQPQALIELLDRLVQLMKDRTIITTGVGQHQMWAAQYFRWQYPRMMITSGGLGTMGYGLPATIGAKVARPEALVIDIDGDASFNMTLNELLTASQFNIGVQVIVLNNEGQGMVTHLQFVYYEDRYCHSEYTNPDFVGAVRAMGVEADCCATASEVEQKLKWLLSTKRPAVLEVMITKRVLSLPMVPSGKGLDEFVYYNIGSDDWDGQ